MRKIFFAVFYLISISSLAQTQGDDIRLPSVDVIFNGREKFPNDTFIVRDKRNLKLRCIDDEGRIWSFPSQFGPYHLVAKLDSVHLVGSNLYYCSEGTCVLAGVIPTGSGVPGGLPTYMQYDSSGYFGGCSAVTADPTHVYIPSLPGSSSSAGSLTLMSTTHATKGTIYFGASQLSGYNEATNVLNVTSNGLGTSFTTGILAQNTTSATSGVPVQNPPAIVQMGTGYATGTSVSKNVGWRLTPLITSSSVPATEYHIQYTLDGGTTWTDAFLLAQAGALTLNSNLYLGGLIYGGASKNLPKFNGTSNGTTIYYENGANWGFAQDGAYQYIYGNKSGIAVTDSGMTSQLGLMNYALACFSSSKACVKITRQAPGQYAQIGNTMGMITMDSVNRDFMIGTGSTFHPVLLKDTAQAISGNMTHTGTTTFNNTVTVPDKTAGSNNGEAANTKYVDAAAGWGTYMPTSSSPTNATVTLDSASWSRNGPMVTCKISGSITPAAGSTYTAFTVTAPLPNNLWNGGSGMRTYCGEGVWVDNSASISCGLFASFNAAGTILVRGYPANTNYGLFSIIIQYITN